MPNYDSKQRRGLSIVTGILQVFIGIGAVPSGLMIILDPSGSSIGFTLELLEGTPFSSYLVPGIFLFAVNGVISLTGGILSFIRFRHAGLLAIGLGIFLLAWVIIQVSLIGLMSWLQPTFFGLGIIELILGILFHKYLREQREKE